MNAKRHTPQKKTSHKKVPRKKVPRKSSPASTDRVTIRRVRSGDTFELVYPRSVLMRAEDMDEVRAMLKAGELDVAEDELRWLVGGCEALLEGHKLLGDLAAGREDWELARVHYAYAYELGAEAAKKGGLRGTLPYNRPNNRALHEAGRGLVNALRALNQPQLAEQVAKQLLAWDPTSAQADHSPAHTSPAHTSPKRKRGSFRRP
ncbi:MAG TPA: hypothetical protein DD670_16060 [Planctomycetaceae bacterium]|nr:hypothetical protein [Planctomycetaceae bacterium]